MPSAIRSVVDIGQTEYMTELMADCAYPVKFRTLATLQFARTGGDSEVETVEVVEHVVRQILHRGPYRIVRSSLGLSMTGKHKE